MKPVKNYILSILLLTVILLNGCRFLTGGSSEPESVIEPDYYNTFTITSPERASFWEPGKPLEIKWITSGSVEKVDIQLYRKTTLIRNLKNNLKNNGSFIWNIPSDIDHSVHYHINIINHNNPDEHELSERFAILD